MKKVLITFFTLGLAFSLYAQTPFASSQKDIDNNFILYSLIAKRCERYIPVDNISDCKDAVFSMMDILDPHLMFPTPESFLFVAFKDDLIRILSDKKTAEYLTALDKELNRYLVEENSRFNLWDFTLKYYQSNEGATQILATLFQDTTQAKLHLLYLIKANVRRSSLFVRNMESLSLTIDTMNSLFDYSPNGNYGVFFPRTIKENLSRGIYHFYVPLYLSQKLKANGTPKMMAFTAPLLMTLTYEFISSTPDYRYLLRDPVSLDPKKHKWTLKDIFASYLGASMGTEKKATKDFKFLSESFGVSTQDTVNALLFN